jgi:hypothetical protein
MRGQGAAGLLILLMIMACALIAILSGMGVSATVTEDGVLVARQEDLAKGTVMVMAANVEAAATSAQVGVQVMATSTEESLRAMATSTALPLWVTRQVIGNEALGTRTANDTRVTATVEYAQAESYRHGLSTGSFVIDMAVIVVVMIYVAGGIWVFAEIWQSRRKRDRYYFRDGGTR